jgi:hypothetical protein
LLTLLRDCHPTSFKLLNTNRHPEGRQRSARFL